MQKQRIRQKLDRPRPPPPQGGIQRKRTKLERLNPARAWRSEKGPTAPKRARVRRCKRRRHALLRTCQPRSGQRPANPVPTDAPKRPTEAAIRRALYRKMQRKRTHTARGNYRHRLQRCRWPKKAWPSARNVALGPVCAACPWYRLRAGTVSCGATRALSMKLTAYIKSGGTRTPPTRGASNGAHA